MPVILPEKNPATDELAYVTIALIALREPFMLEAMKFIQERQSIPAQN
jgi:hypothetical protein